MDRSLNHLMLLKNGPKINIINWLQNYGLIANPLFCGTCSHNMDLVRRSECHVDSYQWRCSACKKKKRLRTNSLFGEFPKTPLPVVLLLIYFWSEDHGRKRTSRALEIPQNLVSQVFRKLEDICTEDLAAYPIIPFGGPTCILKCDESKFHHKRKYNRGRRPINDAWVFGIVSTAYTPVRGYFEVIKKRDRATLLPILRKCLLPGSELHTDDWGAYDGISNHLPNIVTRHRVVNHSLNFVDPVTGVHTQEIESAWNTLKCGIKERKGIYKEDLQSYLNDRMWRQWKGNGDIFLNFISTLTLQYPNVPV